MECENCKKEGKITTNYTVARELSKWKSEGYQTTTIYTKYQILERNEVSFCYKCFRRYNYFRLSISGILGSIILSILLIWQSFLFKIHVIAFFGLIGLWFFSIITNWLMVKSIAKKIPLWVIVLRFFINITMGYWFFLLFENPLPQDASIIIISIGVISDYLMVYYIFKNYQFLISDYSIYLNRRRLRKYYGKNIQFFNVLNETNLKPSH